MIPIYRLVREGKSEGGEIHLDLAALFIDILLLAVDVLLHFIDTLLQHGLAQTLDVVETNVDAPTWYSIIAFRISSTSPPSIPAFSALLKNPSAFPSSSSGARSRRTPCSFLPIHIRQIQCSPSEWESMGLLFQSLSPFSLLDITL